MKRLLVMLCLLLASPALAQTTPAPAPAPAPNPATAPVRVALQTSVGRIVVEVDRHHAPITAGNFLKYVDQKRLDGVIFYRVVKVQDHFGFVQFGIDNNPKLILPAIRHEPTSQTGLRHLDGTLSIARLQPGTAHGDFTISVGDQPSFDADPSRPGDNLGYAAFGHVVEGMDVVMKIFDAPVDPAKTQRGAFKGEVPAVTVKILTARRVTP